MEKELKKIIMVDDDITNLTVAKNALIDQYDVFTVPSGKKLFQIIEKITPDLIMLDVEMPEMNGYDIIKELKSSPRTVNIPIIFLTAKIDPESEIKGLSLGAVDYITKPFSQQLLLKRIEVHLLLEDQKKELKNYSINLEEMVDKKTRTVYELQNAILKTVAELVECRDNVTGGHIERTQRYLRLLVNLLLKHNIYTEELTNLDIDLLIMSSQLHDVGKISIKDSILMKPAKLTKEEFEEIKLHTIMGVNIIKKIEESTTENDFLEYAKVLAGSHHEKWDGSGYPFGLKGDRIPLAGRLMAIVDVYDALTNDRPYKKAYSHEESVEIISSGMGTHFDPHLEEVFLLHEQDFKNIATQTSDVDIVYTAVNSLRLPGHSFSQAVANIVDSRSDTEGGKTERIQRYLKIFVAALLKDGLYREDISCWDFDNFLLSAQLHDIGKIAVKDAILNKPDKLTQEEAEVVKNHVDFGVKVIQQMKGNLADSTLLHHAEVLVGNHHEKWDGTGYPLGLKGQKIPLQGRLMAIIDVYDALTSNRPYREMKPHEEAVEIIKSYSGTYFDPALIRVFLEHEKEFAGGGVG